MPYLRFLVKQGRPLAAVSAVARYIFSQGKLPPLGAGIRSGFRNLFFGKPPTCYYYPPWLAPDFERRLNMQERWHAIDTPPPHSHPFNSRAYNLVNDLSVSSVLELVDSTWTACPVEFRYPFLDRRLARFLLRMPRPGRALPQPAARPSVRWKPRPVLPRRPSRRTAPQICQWI